MTLDNIPPSYSNPPERVDSLHNRHLDHVPVSIEDNAYTTGLTKTTDNFRNRNKHLKNLDIDGYDSSDIDLFDSKSNKFRQKKEEQRRASLKKDWYIVLALTIWAAYIRLYKISQPPSVVFDVKWTNYSLFYKQVTFIYLFLNDRKFILVDLQQNISRHVFLWMCIHL